ncbi:hypothetical protein PWG71_24680 [Nocardiopsis sp. N85]|uniref:hypothetical protein n=1 Tax=Nocardiopsis sp. N85 TaxID=3029400 RepID=UPI00237F66BB|nr:hypothetical protein [Nocardiopsis sp. N85]MDE3724598.1 hypothetical protein [Nocardiopsis sp. N85]
MPYSKECVFGEITAIFSTGETARPNENYYALTGSIDTKGITTWIRSTDPSSGAVRPAQDWHKLDWGHRVVPPAGYHAFSDAPDHQFSWLKRVPKEHLACVKETIDGVDYAVPGDKYSVAVDHGMIFELLRTKRPRQTLEKDSVLIAPDPGFWFCGLNMMGLPIGKDPGQVYVLNLPLPVTRGGNLARPRITDPDDIPQEQNAIIDREVLVPCVAVDDRTKSRAWIVENSPTYTLRRRRSYTLVAALDLRGSSKDGHMGQTVSWGVTDTQTRTYSKSVGITVGFEAGVSVEGVGVKVSGSVTTTLGYSRSFANTEMQQQSVQVDGNAAAGRVTAMYAEKHVIYVVRDDPDHTFCSDDEKNVVTFKAGLRYAIVDDSGTFSGSPALADGFDASAPSPDGRRGVEGADGGIRAVGYGMDANEVPAPEQLTGPNAPEGVPAPRSPERVGRETVTGTPAS